MEQSEPASTRKRHLIARSFDSLPVFHEVVVSILCLSQPLSASALSSLLDIPEDTISEQLNDLRPIVDIPQDVHEPLPLLPIKFKEFIFGPHNEYAVDLSLVHDNLATCCLCVMYNYLKPNICGLTSPGQDRSTIPKQKISSCIPEVLVYACTNWAAHFQASEPATGSTTNLLLEGYLLRWLEVMSLIGRASESITMLQTLRTMALASFDPRKAWYILTLV